MILALVLLVLAPPYLQLNADTLIVSNWTVSEGLPGNSVTRIIQDDDGFLWISSYYGLVRFDGIEFTTLNQSNTPAVLNNRLILFHKSVDGSVWISLEMMGVVRYDASGFKRYSSEHGLTDEHITVMRTMPDGRLIVGSLDGLHIFDPASDRFLRIDLGADRRRNHIKDILSTTGGDVWVSTSNGYAKIEDGRASIFGTGPVLAIVEDGQKRLWVGRYDGLWQIMPDGSLSRPGRLPDVLARNEITAMHDMGGRLLVSVPGDSYLQDTDRFIRIGGEPIPQDDQIIKLFTDSYGVTWLITEKGVTWILDNNRIRAVPLLATLNKASILDVYEDNERNLWFTSRYGGLFRVKRNPIAHIGRLEGLAGENVLGLFIDSRNRLFIGTRDAGFAKVDQGKLENFPRVQTRRYGSVFDFAEDQKGRIWIGTATHGLVRLDESTGTLITYSLGPSVLENDVRAIHADGAAGLWLATTYGLIHFNTDTYSFDRFDRSTGLPSHKLRNITADRYGRLWVSTADNGIFRFDPSDHSVTHLNQASGMPTNHIRAVKIDPEDDDVLWIGSETHGLIRYRQGRFQSISTKDGLPDRVVHSISQRPGGWMWVTTNKGVVRIDKKSLNGYLDGSQTGFHFIIYDEDEGMRNLEANGGFRSGSLINKEESHLLVATQSGLALFPLARPDPDAPPPPVYILDGVRHHTSMTKVLSHGRNDADVRYAGLRYSSPYGVRYQYRLIGLSDEWTDDFNREVIHLNDLAPGEYRFEVISWNEAGTRSSEPAVITLIVEPAYWQTLWFWSLVSLALGSGVWMLIHIRTRKIKSIRDELEVLVAERTDDLQQEKAEVEKQKAVIEEQAAHLEDLIQTRDKFFAIVGHDLRGPFQTLLGLSQLMVDEYDHMDDHEIRQSLRHLRSSSENLHRLVENLLEWSTLHKGSTKLLIEPIDINALAESTVRLFGPSASVKGIHFEAIVPDKMVVRSDTSIVETIIRNFVSNAIKFTKTEGIVVLEAGLGETDWWVQVSDNGIGMTETMRKNVLNIDKSIKRKGTVNEWGTGLGLALCNELMKVHGGRITVESETGVGSRFTATFHNRS